MGILRLRFAIYIFMAVFAVQKFSHETIITSSSNSDTYEPETNNFVDSNNTVIPAPTKPKVAGDLVIPKLSEESITTEAILKPIARQIAAPESLVTQESASKASRTSTVPSVQFEYPTQKQNVVEPTVVSPVPQASSSIPVLGTEGTSAQPSAQNDGSIPMVRSAAPNLALATRPASVNSHRTRNLQEIPTLEGSSTLLSPDTRTREVVEQPELPPSPLEAVEPLPAIADGAQKNLVGERVSYWEGEQGRRPTPQVAQTSLLANLQSHSAKDLQGVQPPRQSTILLASRDISTLEETVSPQQSGAVVAQATPAQSQPEVERLQDELRTLEDVQNDEFRASPALSMAIPTGFGADNNTGFISATFQQRTRDVSGISDGGLGFGIALGDARRSVGVELSYASASFGSSRDFGSGGFNAKVHRQLGNDWAVAAGWNGFLNIGDDNDFEDSVYGVVTKVIRTRDDISLPLSRIALTVGVGNGQFRTESAVTDDSGEVNVFGNIAVRVAQPISVIAEWSGQDLGVGLSIAPFKNIPLVITPAVRDLTGAGDEPRFVLGTGFAFRF